MISPADEARAQVQAMLAEARQAFASDVDALLTELKQFSDGLGDALGEISREEALRGMRTFVLEKFEQRLPPPRALADVLTIQNQRALIAELVDACKRLLQFNEQLCADVNVSTHYPSADFARDVIAKAEKADV